MDSCSHTKQIDGLDVNKFKEVNNTNERDSNSAPATFVNDFGESLMEVDDPTPAARQPVVFKVQNAEKLSKGAVPPRYDVTEEQLMTAIEQEYGY